MEYDIAHNPAENRFQTEVDRQLCVLDYTLDDGVISMHRVYVPPPVEGRGIAGAITRHALDYSREKHWKVIPRCPYVAAWIERHPDYQELVAEKPR
ncbi:MAG: N-acetyltransferase [Wenzhouxiangellaceae bacterium]|nr:N-acetyltransferase [Wenzhouxiangellaceae bacterium]MBS3747735.1 N-acetyltransferase [Wenzhouxiangellaceae bacterium]MBS3822646.1 N-acetyltransferase [Wenzhouxiangellaceae bacterium]